MWRRNGITERLRLRRQPVEARHEVPAIVLPHDVNITLREFRLPEGLPPAVRYAAAGATGLVEVNGVNPDLRCQRHTLKGQTGTVLGTNHVLLREQGR